MRFGTFLLRIGGTRDAELDDLKRVCDIGPKTFQPDGQKNLYIEIKTKTGLGVLASYLRIAGFCGLATIAISAVYLLDMDFQAIQEMLIQWQYGTFWLATIPKVLFALSCALFAVNVFSFG